MTLKLMKKILNFFSDNSLQLLEVIICIIISCIPIFLDVKKMFKVYLDENYLSPDNVLYYLAIEKGNYCISILLMILSLLAIRKYNENKIMNTKNIYHDYCHKWYCFCSKILGFKKCNLVLVPIFMQFKLVSNEIFEDFPLDDNAYPDDETSEIKVIKTNWASNPNIINVILEDTYPIKQTQIPSNKRILPTIKISRTKENDFGRYFSQKFINNIITEIKKLPPDVTINLFATTNPKHTLQITRRVFVTGGRGNIKNLYVFQQEQGSIRNFLSKGKRIY